MSFWGHIFCGQYDNLDQVKVNHTSWVAVAIQTDRPKSACVTLKIDPHWKMTRPVIFQLKFVEK